VKSYRVALLGCRGRGTALGRAYHAHPRTEVVALCDLLPERLEVLGDELGVSARFADVDEMMVQTRPDIVVIATGTEFHYDLCMRVLEHRVHLDVEKPLCVDLEQADAVLAEARERGVRVAVHHQGRVGASMQAVAQAVGEGRLGQLRYLHGSGKGYYGGYGLLNIGTHTLNNMLRFGGRCRRVSAIALTDGRSVEPRDVVQSPSGMGTIAGEHLTATLQFEGNVTGTLLQHRFPEMDSTAYHLRLYGTKGQLVWKSGGAWLLPTAHFAPDGTHDRWQELDPIYPDHYDPECGAAQDDYWFVEEYVRALDEGRDHECSGAEGLHVLEIMMGIFESAAYGRSVDLPQNRRDHPLLRWRRENGLGEPEPMPRDYGQWLAEEDQRLGRAA
jgi:predicted dehydrogenase